MTKLTTHVLDVYSGKPGKDIKVDLYFIESQKKVKINSLQLNNDGRADKPLVENENFKVGKYELVFFVGSYFESINKLKQPYFLDDIIVRFGINNPSEHYHVPLLVSPWSYSTYRGS